MEDFIDSKNLKNILDVGDAKNWLLQTMNQFKACMDYDVIDQVRSCTFIY